MCKIFEEVAADAAKEASEQTRIDLANNLIRIGKLSLEEIATTMELPISRVEELAASAVQ
jgi:DNA-directed RNA polymerase specialized sigma24 family protein